MTKENEDMMKKTIAIMLCAFILVSMTGYGCSPKDEQGKLTPDADGQFNFEFGHSYYFKKVEYEGHEYIFCKESRGGAIAMTHSPDCPCGK